jgi:hypothetical protein
VTARLSGLTSNDHSLETALSEWLQESRMSLPPGFRLSLDTVERLPALDDRRPAFRQGQVEIRAGEPLGWAQVSWPGLAQARIEELEPRARVLLTREALADRDRFFRSFLLIVLIFLWKRDQRFHIHAGTAIDPMGRGWMLTGTSGAGKSTTTAWLATRLWQIGTDDIAFLVDRGERVGVLGFRDRIALRSGALGLVPLPEGLALDRRGKLGYWPEELGARWVQTVEPEIVLFAEGLGARTVFRKSEPREILDRLIRSSAWVMFEATGASEHLALLSRLGGQARCYAAILGPDLFTHPDALAGFLP